MKVKYHKTGSNWRPRYATVTTL